MTSSLVTKQEAFALRESLGLISHKFIKYKVVWYRYPALGCVLSAEILYHSSDIPHYSPMLSSTIYLSLVPELTRKMFEEIVNSHYSKSELDKGALRAHRYICIRYKRHVVQHEDSSLEQNLDPCVHKNSIRWNKQDIGNIRASDIQLVYESLNEKFLIYTPISSNTLIHAARH